ncbi:helix-turn-helix domain-containing protein [Metabacillus litoralis]|uniref:AraC family transcriptional regulator n=1 Tax=Metabacillus litoralis TaxID=152268 RepID=UPI001B92B345|nr:helix-turn-helix domain-containing protein [Metabacillus litoralis]MCM3412760.1 helix-turn-helix domain-containing protein [Metabacillus litoralis]UHA60000.1 helix-turn-helix domain-containing protein [Metabacillus litoralis]
MNHNQLDQFLRRLDEIEKIQVLTNENINDFDGRELVVNEGQSVPRLDEKYFFDKGPIFISKHHRFADMPLHMHTFIEMNYVYSGVCRQLLNGKEIKLTEGQICLLDRDVPHSIPALGENDIVVNILMKKDPFTMSLLGQLSKRGIVSSFLMNAILENQHHDRYILFRSEQNQNLQYIVKNMLCEYFAPQEYSFEMVNYYMPILLTELMRVYQLDKNFELTQSSGKTSILNILHYIEKNYKDCTLTSLAETFNFNANYLGNMLKEKTGKTFLDLVQSQKMIESASLLKNTDKSIEDIAYQVGYDSLSFFYRKFKEFYGETPTSFRKDKK